MVKQSHEQHMNKTNAKQTSDSKLWWRCMPLLKEPPLFLPPTTANFRVICSGLIQAPLKKLEHYKHFNSTKTKRVILLLLPRD
jgi:hypothetical protein